MFRRERDSITILGCIVVNSERVKNAGNILGQAMTLLFLVKRQTGDQKPGVTDVDAPYGYLQHTV